MRRSIFHRLATMTVMVALVCAGLAVTSPAAEAVTQLNYIVKYTGTDAGYPIQRYGWVVIVVGLPPIPGLQGSNQVDLCFYSGNAYAIEPGSIQVETRTNVCPFDQTLANPPVQLATVQVTSASATTF